MTGGVASMYFDALEDYHGNGHRDRLSPASGVEVRLRRSSGTAIRSLDRVSVHEVLAGGPVREFPWYPVSPLLFGLVLVGHDGRDGAVQRRHVAGSAASAGGRGALVVHVKPAHRMDDPAVRAVFDWALLGWPIA